MFVWKEDWFRVSSKVNLFYRACLPDTVRGHILIIHGYAEHSGRYCHVMEYLAERGYSSYAPDIRGHGRSARFRGDLDGFDGAVDDIEAFKDFITGAYRARPLFLLGHSLGGTIALCLSSHPLSGIAGAAVIAPSFVVPAYASPFLIAVAGVLAVFLPRLPAQPFPLEQVCRDADVLEAARRDPLCYRGRMRARTGCQILRGIRRCRSAARRLSLPLLILHGGADRIMPLEGSRELFDAAASADKSLIVYDGFFHEVLNEPEKDRPLSDIAAWLDRRNGSIY